MQRRLIVMRHASSAAGSKDITDHQRPLTEKGHREAEEIAGRLVESGWVPGRVLSSDATRTRETWETMQSVFDTSVDAWFDHSLYLAGIDAAQQALANRGGDAPTVLLLGHNPGWQAIISYLAGKRERMMTANAALLETDAARWEDTMAPGCFELVEILRPATL